MKHHPRIWERPMLLLLFLFGLGAWNRAWVFFLLLAALSLALWGLRTDFSRSEVLLLFFSLFYALADTYHGGLSLRGCALYLLGPWVFYRLGKAYALHTGSCSGFCQLLAAPSLGMWLHGLLNWLARLRWQGEALPARTAVDFWRGEPVSVTCTGMLLTAAAALALAAALASGQVAWAAADVVSVEPMRPDNPLLGAPNCLITPHFAAFPIETRRRLLEQTVENLAAWRTGRPINVVSG